MTPAGTGLSIPPPADDGGQRHAARNPGEKVRDRLRAKFQLIRDCGKLSHAFFVMLDGRFHDTTHIAAAGFKQSQAGCCCSRIDGQNQFFMRHRATSGVMSSCQESGGKTAG
ncbi:hypothetical protein [Pararhodobacter sp.]|uniref:hypothetical protein n=1 Tax=Pararhodobacter sp. TaxID=2127056 RepID=UPI002AFF05C6|nr:hypothetical protein [Pararhodobacter sp.]